MNTTNAQLELPIAVLAASFSENKPARHLDWPLQPLPASTLHELQRLSSRWSRGQTLRGLRVHGLR
jgi:hypothetical protein